MAFRPGPAGGTQRARLVIHQNLPGDPTFVALTGESPPRPPPAVDLDLVAPPDNAECVHQPAGAVGGRDAMQVFFKIWLVDATPSELPGLVKVTMRSDGGAAADAWMHDVDGG